MKITVITLFPEMIRPFINESIIKRAQEKKVVTIEIINLRDYAIDSYGSVDDRPYGGGAGMVMRIEPLVKAIQSVILASDPHRAESASRISDSGVVRHHVKRGFTPQNDDRNKPPQISPFVALTSPRGQIFNQQKAIEYSKLNHLVLIAGHYEGVDERISKYIDEEISIGDFIVTGGEIAVSAIIDSVVRLLPGALTKKDATQEESFMEVDIEELEKAIGENKTIRALKMKGQKKVKLLEYPHYTRPEEFEGEKAPNVLLSGDPKKIRLWRLLEAFKKTVRTRKDLLS